jgi:hypothetical protein
MYGKDERLRDIIQKKENGKSNTDKILKTMFQSKQKQKRKNIRLAQKKAHPKFRKF